MKNCSLLRNARWSLVFFGLGQLGSYVNSRDHQVTELAFHLNGENEEECSRYCHSGKKRPTFVAGAVHSLSIILFITIFVGY